jgi:MSHA pilin protein MshD
MSTSAAVRKSRVRQAGLTMVELIMFIVIVSVGIVGILLVLNVTVKSSADPVIRKNMLSIAEALLEEVQMMPFTYCDPTDANASTATSAAIGPAPAGCATLVESLGPEAGETRTSATTPFNNVNDYYVAGGLNLPSPISDISSTYTAPAGYSASIQIVAENLGSIASAYPPASTMEALRIAVTVSHGSDSITIEGYRARHSPNYLP